MKSKTKQLVKSLENLNIGANKILSKKQLKFVTGGEPSTTAATIRAANS